VSTFHLLCVTIWPDIVFDVLFEGNSTTQCYLLLCDHWLMTVTISNWNGDWRARRHSVTFIPTCIKCFRHWWQYWWYSLLSIVAFEGKIWFHFHCETIHCLHSFYIPFVCHSWPFLFVVYSIPFIVHWSNSFIPFIDLGKHCVVLLHSVWLYHLTDP